MINRENDDITSPNFCALKFLLWLQIDESMPICPFFLTKKIHMPVIFHVMLIYYKHCNTQFFIHQDV